MKYSLRSLVITAIVAPPILALIIWQLLPKVEERGTAANMAEFLRVIKQPPPSGIFEARENCFVIGSPASNYRTMWVDADRIFPETPTRTVYIFWVGGKEPTEVGDEWVEVEVDGTPPSITGASIGQCGPGYKVPNSSSPTPVAPKN
jgi:hypothetical protein